MLKLPNKRKTCLFFRRLNSTFKTFSIPKLPSLPAFSLPQVKLPKFPTKFTSSKELDKKRQHIFTVTEAAKFLGVTAGTLRNWERAEKLIPARTKGGSRRYWLKQLKKVLIKKNPYLASIAGQSDKLKTHNWDQYISNYKDRLHRIFVPHRALFVKLASASILAFSVAGMIFGFSRLPGNSGINSAPATERELKLANTTSDSRVLQAATSLRAVDINAQTNINGTLTVNGDMVFSGGITGKVVQSIGGQTGALTLEEGTGIDIEDLEISVSANLNDIRILGGCTACIKDADLVDDITISSSGKVAIGALDGTLTIGKGGTGLTSYTTGNLIYASATDTLAKLAIGSSNQVLTISSGIPAWSSSLSLGSTLGVSGAASLNGAVTLGDAASDTITVTGRMGSSIVPATTGTYDLGSSSLQWSKLYLTGVATIGGQSTFTSVPTGTSVGDGVIYINPASADSSYTLFGIAVNGTEKLRMDADGNITVQGTIVGATGQSVGYWQRSGTSVSPATSNDIVSYSSNNTTNAFVVTATGASANAINLTADSVTTGNGLSLSVDGLTTGNGMSLTSTSTAGGTSGASYLLNLARSGTNSNASHTAYGLYSAVTDTGTTSTNVAGYFSASGASTNYGLIVNAGNVGIGDTSPSAPLEVGDGTDSLQVSSVGDLTFVDADGGASITGPAGGALTISGGSSQTMTLSSSVATGTTTAGAWALTGNSLTSGTGLYVSSSSLTTGKLAQFSTGSANTLTTGTLLDLRTTATSLTGAAGTGSMLNLDWSPGSATTATGDLFALNIGTNGTTTGNLFNILDASSSIFSVSEVAVTTSLPFNETAPGDVSMAYDLVFTNPTASFITSSSSLNIVAGDSPDSNNLILSTYNQGEIVLNPAITTGTGIDFNNATLTTGIGMNLAASALTTGSVLKVTSTSTAGGVSGASYLLNLARSGTNSNASHTAYGVYSAVTDTGTTSTNVAGYFSASGATNNYGLIVENGSVGIGDTTPTSKLDISDTSNTAASLALTNNTATTIGAAASLGVANLVSTSLTTGALLNLELTEGTLAGGYYLRGWDATAGSAVFSVGEDGNTTIAGLEGSNMLTLTAGDAAISDGSLSITDDDDATSLSLTNNTATTVGAGINTAGVVDISSTSLTTGNLVNLETTTTLTTGKVLNISSTSTALTTGNLFSLDWSPGSVQTTAATGDLFKLNIGSNASNFAGNLFNILDSSSSIFSVSKTSVTSAIPISVTAPGDVSVAYDIALANPTASYITSVAPLYLVAGNSFDSSDLTLTTYNMGSVVIEGIVTSSSTAATKYAQYINTGDTTTTADTIYGSYITNALTGNAAKTGVGLYSTISTSSTTADTLLAADLATSTSGIITTGTRAIYGLRSQPASTGASTGGTTNVYGVYAKPGGVVGAGGTINSYGLYVANGTMDGTGTSTNYGLYVETPSGADTNYAAIFAGGNVGIGDTTPDALLDLDSGSTSGGDFLITNTGISASGTIAGVTANSATTGDILTLSATALSTGSVFLATGPSSTGVTDHFTKLTSDIGSGASLLNLNPDFSGAGVTGYGIYNLATDATAQANTDYGYYGSLALTGNAAKTGVGLYSTVTSSSTTADTLISSDLATDVTGIMTTGTRNIYGLRSQPAAGAESTGGTTNVYGGYFKATGDVAAGGTINNYGLYVANGTYDTDGTNTAYGLYIESPTGADTNYGAYINGASILGTNVTIDPDTVANSIIAGNIADGGGWSATGIGGKGAGDGDTWAIGYVSDTLYFASGNTSASNTLATFMSVDATNISLNHDSVDKNLIIKSDNNAAALVLDAGLFAGVGQLSIGAVAQATPAAFMVINNPAITATANQNFYKLLIDNTSAVTVPTGTAAIVASLALNEPNITATGTVTDASTLYISGAPTEATRNHALWIDAGTSRFDGAVAYGAQQTFVDSDATPDVSAGTNWITNTTTFTITDFDAGSGTLQAGHIIYVESAGALTYDVTTSGLEGGAADFTTAAGDMTIWLYDGTQWKLINWVETADTQSGGADLAELYSSDSSLEPGDVVSIPERAINCATAEQQASLTTDTSCNSELQFAPTSVVKSTTAHDKRALGIVSTKPGIILKDGTETGNTYPIALAGRVPVKMSQGSLALEPGDYITSSSEPGLATKATRAGQMLGKALGAWVPGQKTVLVFVNTIYADPNFSLTLSDSGEINNVILGNVETPESDSGQARVTELSDQIKALDAKIGNLSTITDLSFLTDRVRTLEAFVLGEATPSAQEASTSGLQSAPDEREMNFATTNDLDLTGNLTILGKSILSDTSITGTLTVGLVKFDPLDQSINAVGILKFQDSLGGGVQIDQLGNVIIDGSLTAGDLSLPKNIGEVKIPAGKTSATVTNENVKSTSAIFLSPVGQNIGAYVFSKNDGEFTIKIPLIAPSSGFLVQYLIINQ